jgi:hypothetical protein
MDNRIGNHPSLASGMAKSAKALSIIKIEDHMNQGKSNSKGHENDAKRNARQKQQEISEAS